MLWLERTKVFHFESSIWVRDGPGQQKVGGRVESEQALSPSSLVMCPSKQGSTECSLFAYSKCFTVLTQLILITKSMRGIIPFL